MHLLLLMSTFQSLIGSYQSHMPKNNVVSQVKTNYLEIVQIVEVLQDVQGLRTGRKYTEAVSI